MAAGIHTYNFSCQLPSEIPQSVEEKYGVIKYKVSAIPEIPFNFGSKISVPFTVMRKVNLSENPSLKKPITVLSQPKPVGFFGSPTTSSCNITVTLPNGIIYNKGEIIPVKIHFDDKKCQHDIYATKISLKKNVVYTSKGKSQKVKKDKTINRVILNGNSSADVELSISVPLTAAFTTMDEICKIMKINYELRVKGEYCSQEARIPITIANFVDTPNESHEANQQDHMRKL